MSEERMDGDVVLEEEGGQDAGAAAAAEGPDSSGAPRVPEPEGGPTGTEVGRVAWASGARTPKARGRRKVREGIARSVAMDKTVVVEVVERVRHPRYGKTVQRSRHLYVHDEANEVRSGDRVRVAETRPLSKTKRWRLVEIVERAR